MKKVLASGLLAICAIALMHQEAHAWKNIRFGVGLNWDYQSGGNNALWGAWKNGQPPGPEYWNSGAYQPRYQGPIQGYSPSPWVYPEPTYYHHDHHHHHAQESTVPMYQYAMPSYTPAFQYGNPFQFATSPR